MAFEASVYSISRRSYIVTSSILLLVAGFVLDIATSQDLVVAITYNIPIALAGLRLSKRFSYSILGAALVANVIAGITNANAQGGADAVAITNRVLAGLSFLLVGYMTLELSRITTSLATLGFEQARTEREDALRKFLIEVSGPFRPQAFLGRTAAELRSLLQADTVVISGLSHNRFTLPRASDPDSALGRIGETAPWMVAATPTKDMPVLSARVDKDLMTVGRWHRQNDHDLVIMARRPKVKQPEVLLGETLRNLEPLYERAKALEDLDKERQELARRNTVIRDLVYAFSHDIRTPLMANAMTMKLALEGAYGKLSEDYEQTLRHGLSANEALLDLADSLLLVARHESSEETPQLETVDMAMLVRQVAAQQSAAAEGRSVSVKLALPENLNLLGRENELKRLVQNLLGNAVKFSLEGGVVELTLKRRDESASEQGLQLEVLDRGTGIPSEQRHRLFQRFSSGKAGGGIGLGLYLAKQIAQAHRGYIHYEERDGGGSRFVVWLPLAAELVTA